MNIIEARTWITQELAVKYSQEHAAVLAQQLLSWALNKSAAELLAYPDKPLSRSEIELITKTLREHLEDHKPLQYAIGSVPFLSATITVRPPILIPRPETEWWVDLMIRLLKQLNRQDLTLLDMCTGSGCIAISLAQAFPKATVYAVDIKPEALKLAKENAALNHCSNIIFVQSDLFTNLPEVIFDCILSNPPYISSQEYKELDLDVKLWEDPQALLAENNGLSRIAQIIKETPRWVKKNPLFAQHQVPQLALEIGEHQAPHVMSLMQESDFIPKKYTDLAGKDRLITGELLHA